MDDQALIVQLQSFLHPYIQRFTHLKLEYVSILVHYTTEQPALFTFRSIQNYTEDPITRHILPSLVPMLEIHRLKHFHITLRPTANRNIHVFEARPKVELKGRYDGRRFFVRSQVTQRTSAVQLVNDLFKTKVRVSGPEMALMEAINSLESAMGGMSSKERAKWQFNQIFLSCFFDIDHSEIQKVTSQFSNGEEMEYEKSLKLAANAMIAFARAKLDGTMTLLKDLLRDLYVTRIEVRIQGSWMTQNDQIQACRMCCDIPTSECYESSEFWEVVRSNGVVYKSVKDHFRPTRLNSLLENTLVSVPHPVEEPLMQQRVVAKLLSTTYVYDWIELFKQAMRDLWRDRIPDGALVVASELVLDSDQAGELREVKREPGQNDIAMVAWRLTVKTLNYPEGRTFILVANDITNQVGTFGKAEDELYYRALQVAEREGIPFLYMASNSGARMGLDNELMRKFKVAWKGDAAVDPQSGFNYLY